MLTRLKEREKTIKGVQREKISLAFRSERIRVGKRWESDLTVEEDPRERPSPFQESE